LPGSINAMLDPLRDDPRYQDRDGNLWIINYRPEFFMNAVLASIFARLSGCCGTEVCSSFLDYRSKPRSSG